MILQPNLQPGTGDSNSCSRDSRGTEGSAVPPPEFMAFIHPPEGAGGRGGCLQDPGDNGEESTLSGTSCASLEHTQARSEQATAIQLHLPGQLLPDGLQGARSVGGTGQ